MKSIALDIEAIGLDPYNGTIWSLTVNDGKTIIVEHDCFGKATFLKKYRKVLEDPNTCKVIHNAGYDGPYIVLFFKQVFGIDVRIKNIWDTMLCETVIQGVQIPKNSRDQQLYIKHSAKLEFTLPRYGFSIPDKDITKNFIGRPIGKKFTMPELKYMEDDVKDLLKLQKAQEYLLTRDGLLEVALLENLNVERVIDAKVHGIGWDGKIWKKIAEDNEKEFKKRMALLPSTVDNWNSPKKVKDYFKSRGILINSFDEIDKVYATTKNKTLGDFIEARNLTKSITAYGMNWFKDGFCNIDGRVRASIQQIVNTGRYSMYNPNLQQLPAKGLHRSAFVPRKGYKFVIGDFSGQEMGIMAAASKEDLWIDAMLRGDDIHSLTASLLYATQWATAGEKGCTFPKKCSCKGHKLLREPTKILNFMLAYGGGPNRFAENTGCTLAEAQTIVKRYRKVVPRLTMWLNNNAREALKTGVSFSADPYKRRRLLKGVEDWQIENQGKNNPVQSPGANMIKLAMNSISWEYYIPLVIHDEIILEVPTKSAKVASKHLKKIMEESADYITGIKGLIKVTPRIADNLMKE